MFCSVIQSMCKIIKCVGTASTCIQCFDLYFYHFTDMEKSCEATGIILAHTENHLPEKKMLLYVLFCR